MNMNNKESEEDKEPTVALIDRLRETDRSDDDRLETRTEIKTELKSIQLARILKAWLWPIFGTGGGVVILVTIINAFIRPAEPVPGLVKPVAIQQQPKEPATSPARQPDGTMTGKVR